MMVFFSLSQHHPEVYAVTLLSEVTLALPDDHSMWLNSLRHHSIVMILIRIANGYLNVRLSVIIIIMHFLETLIFF